MKIPAISGLMLALASSAVTAAPAKEETAERVSYTREGEKRAAAPGDWVELASPTPASHGREFITVEGRFSQLRIDASKGRPMVKTVRVVYANGKQRVVRVQRSLAGNRPTALVDLDGSQVDHIVVDTDPHIKGMYTVSAAPVSTGVATR
jgi:hypothetical protein